MLRYKTKQDLV